MSPTVIMCSAAFAITLVLFAIITIVEMRKGKSKKGQPESTATESAVAESTVTKGKSESLMYLTGFVIGYLLCFLVAVWSVNLF